MQKAKKFPQQVQLSERRVGIPENEIVEWVNLRKNVDGSQHFPSTPWSIAEVFYSQYNVSKNIIIFV